MPPASVAYAPPPTQPPPCRSSPCSWHGRRRAGVPTASPASASEDHRMMMALWHEEQRQEASADELAAAFAAAPASAPAWASDGTPLLEPTPAPGTTGAACGGDACFSFWMSFGNTALIIFDVFAIYVCCFMAH